MTPFANPRASRKAEKWIPAFASRYPNNLPRVNKSSRVFLIRANIGATSATNTVTFITSENLATGSKYEDIDLTGTQVGGGYEAPLGDMAFWRAEGSMQMWEDISASGSESGGTSGSKNKIAAELGSVVGTLSVGMKF